jgi:Flp pilus assembly protein TadG
VVAVETALVASLILVPLLLGLWDLSQVTTAKVKVEQALQDAITYVAAGNTGSSGIASAAQAAYGSSIQVSSSTVCYCVGTGSSGVPSAVSCASSCGSGYDFEQFTQITTSLSVAIPVPVRTLGLGSTLTVTATGSVRTG